MATFTGTAGVDSFKGTAGAADVFRFFPGDLAATDTVAGRLGRVSDTLQLLGAGMVSASQLANVSGIEEVIMFAGSSIDLTADMLATARNTTITIVGSGGNDGVFGGNITDAAHRLLFTAGAGRDTFLGGAGDDMVSIGAGEITRQDSFSGGGGSDVFQITSAGSLANTALANVFSFESISLHSGGNSIRLSQATVGSAAGGVVTVEGSDGVDRVTANTVTSGQVVFNAGDGANSFFGGAGADIASGASGVEDFQGNGGNDTLSGGGGDNFLDGGGGGDSLSNGLGASRVTGGAGRDTMTVYTIDIGRPDTLVYNKVTEGTALGDVVRGDVGFVVDGDVAFAFKSVAFNTVDSNFDKVNFDDGTDGAGSDGADLVLYNDGDGAGLGSAAAVDAYFFENYFFIDDVGAFLADYDHTDNSVTIYYDPDAFSTGAVYVIARIENMDPVDHAALGDDFSIF